jgi:hypothetical protein
VAAGVLHTTCAVRCPCRSELRRGRSFGAGLSVGAVGAGWARGWMDEGAELAGGFAVVADSQVRVFEHRDTMVVGWGASGRGLARGTRDGRRAAAWRRPCVARATGRDAERRRDGSTRASYGMARDGRERRGVCGCVCQRNGCRIRSRCRLDRALQ